MRTFPTALSPSSISSLSPSERLTGAGGGGGGGRERRAFRYRFLGGDICLVRGLDAREGLVEAAEAKATGTGGRVTTGRIGVWVSERWCSSSILARRDGGQGEGIDERAGGTSSSQVSPSGSSFCERSAGGICPSGTTGE